MNINSILIPAIVGGIAGGLAVLWKAKSQPQRQCPECGAPLPKFRKPKGTTMQQTLMGGWTCPNCSCDVDRDGKKRES